MKLKGIELEGAYRVIYDTTSFVIYDEEGKQIYCEDIYGFWVRWEYDEKGKVIYSEDSNRYWVRRKYNEKDKVIYSEDSNGRWLKNEYDEKGNQIYFEDSEGIIIDKRVKELTIKQIEKLLGYKIKIKGE